MSWLSKYVFDPIKAAIARSESSATPPSTVLNTAGQAALADVKTAALAVGTQALSGTLTANSALGTGSTLVGNLEDDLKDAVDTAVTAYVGEVPVVGAFLAPEAKNMADTGLTMLESHVHDYIASLFAHAKTTIAATPSAPLGGAAVAPVSLKQAAAG